VRKPVRAIAFKGSQAYVVGGDLKREMSGDALILQWFFFLIYRAFVALLGGPGLSFESSLSPGGKS
jgi:hypothetical protein